MITRVMRATLLLAMSASIMASQEAPAPAGANLLFQPTASNFTFGEGTSAVKVEQYAIPLAMIFPLHRRFTVDVTSAWAQTRVTVNDSTLSEIVGPTDTQIRANWELMLDHLVLTLGINAPSGQYKVDSLQAEAAGRIGNDFLFFPISSMGNGPAGTVGLAAAVSLLHINFGVGGSIRKAMEFTPLVTGAAELRYQPADEIRFRLSADRRLWIGTASVGVTFSQFGEDVLDATTYSTGDRVITTAGWSIPIKSASLVFGLWDLARDAGEQFGGPAPKENIRNLSGALNLPVKRWTFQPVVETRRWEAQRTLAGELLSYGLGIAIRAGATMIIEPRFTQSSGKLYSPLDGTPTEFTGWQGSLLIRQR